MQRSRFDSRVIFASVLCLMLFACMRRDVATAHIVLPDLHTERDVRIVTNAALHQLSAELPDPKHWCTVDLEHNTLMYHEGHRLLSPQYVSTIRESLTNVGYASQVVTVRYNSPPPLRLRVEGQERVFQSWPDRYSLLLNIPAMRTNMDANRAVDAIAYVRLGGMDPRIGLRRDGKGLVIADYDRMRCTSQNFQYMIATAGYATEDFAANLGWDRPPPRGWEPVRR